jgi:protein-S-isoprenylcysteine O-methyltransferase Ste14
LGGKNSHLASDSMQPLVSASTQLVAFIALIRCAGVLAAVIRQGLRLKRTAVTKWGWVETFASPEPLLMAVFAYVLLRGGSAAASKPAHAILAFLGGALAVLGISLWLWAFRTIPSLSSGHYVLPEQQLVTRGPYALVRHPIYLAVLLLWLAVSAAGASLAALATTVLYVVPAYVLYARSEERMMLAHFGTSYELYKRCTGMLVPRLRVPRNT